MIAAIERYSGTSPKFSVAPNLATSNVMLNAIDLTFVGVLPAMTGSNQRLQGKSGCDY